MFSAPIVEGFTLSIRYVFGDFYICLDTRTVSKGEEVRTTERIVFDVLAHLIAERHRVVSKQDLLLAVWGKVIVTDGAITRAVMKARRLLDDDAHDPKILKTVHRVGYRFMADILELDGESRYQPGRDRDAGVSLPPLRIAILPFHNDTGPAGLEWMDLGLMSVTIEILQSTMKGQVISAREIAAIAAVDKPRRVHEEIARKLRDAVAASDMVFTSISMDRQTTEVTLTYEGGGDRLGGLLGSETGHDPVELCQRLARRILSRVARSGLSARRPEREALAASSTHFLNQIRAKAREAIDTERWDWARKLLRVALDAAPDDVPLNLDYARTLLSQRDPAVNAVLNRLQAIATESQSPALDLRLHLLRSDQRINEGGLSAAEHMLTQCLKMAEEQGDAEAELRATVSFAELLTIEGRGAIARWTIGRASKLALKLGNRLALARLREIEGRLSLVEGDQAGAINAFTSAVALSERGGMCGSAAFALQHLGVCHLSAGQFRLGADCFKRALQYACLSGQPMAIALAGSNASLYGQSGEWDPENSREIISHLRRMRERSIPAVRACIDVAEGLALARQGDLARGFALLANADIVFSNSFNCHVRRQRIRILTCLGHLDEAASLCDELKMTSNRLSKSFVEAAMLHGSALVMSARGRSDSARDLLVQSTRQWSRPTIQSVDAELDLAWLELDDGQPVLAERRLQTLGKFMLNALSDEYQPAMLVQARWLFESGARDEAVQLQERYCELTRSRGSSPAAQLAIHYAQQGARMAPRLALLPSLSELRPDLQLASS